MEVSVLVLKVFLLLQMLIEDVSKSHIFMTLF